MSFAGGENRSRDPEELRQAAKARGRELIRRRRIGRAALVAVLSVAGLGAVASVVVFGPRSSPSSTSGARPSKPSAALSSISLPAADLFNQITVANGHLLLSGETAASAAATPAQAARCVSATVERAPLALGARRSVNCNDPASYGETVGVVNSNSPHSYDADVSIARLDPRTGKTSVGPVVMTYGSYSDTRPVMAYGGGWLWIYDNDTLSGPAADTAANAGTAEVLQVSTASGQVVDTVPMPKLYKPLMAANDSGLFIGNSVEGGTCSGCAPPSALYFVAPGSRREAVAMADTTTVVCWLLGSGDNLWVGTGRSASGCSKETILRLDGRDFQPVFAVADQGYLPETVIGNAAVGLWTMQWTQPPTTDLGRPSPQEIVAINPATGAETVVATLPPLVVPLTALSGGEVPGEAAILDGSFYLLEPPFKENGYLGYSRLVRVRLPRWRR